MVMKTRLALIKKAFDLLAQGESQRSIHKADLLPRRTLGRYIEKAKAFGASFDFIAYEATDEQLIEIFAFERCHKQFIEPKWEEIFDYLYPPRTWRKDTRSIESAWRNCYLKDKFNIKGINRYCPDELPDGCMSYNTFVRRFDRYRNNRSLFPKLSNTCSIEQYSPASQMAIDGVGDKIIWHDRQGNTYSGTMFVSVLTFSGLTFAYICPKARTVDWMTFLQKSLQYIGGVPASVKSDNDVSLCYRVRHSNAYGKVYCTSTPNANAKFLANSYGFEWVLTGVAKPRDKALCERIVKLYEDFKSGLVLGNPYVVADNIEELNRLLAQDIESINNSIISGKDFSRRAFFEENERKYLAPLPNSSYMPIFSELGSYIVNSRGYVRFKGNDYFLGNIYVSHRVLCNLTPDNIIEFLDYDTLSVIEAYPLNHDVNPRPLRFKHDKYKSSIEKHLSASLDAFIKKSELFPDLKEELKFLFNHFWAKNTLPTIDKTNTCHEIIKLAENAPDRALFKQALMHLNKAKIYNNVAIKEALRAATYSNTESNQIPKKERSNPQCNLRGTGYFLQKINSK